MGYMAHINPDNLTGVRHIVVEDWNDYQKRKREHRNFEHRLLGWKIKFWLYCFIETSLFISYIGTGNFILGTLTLSFFICGLLWLCNEGNKIENPNEDSIVESFKSLYSDKNTE